MATQLHPPPNPSANAQRELPVAPIRVLVAHDHALMRLSLRLLLESQDNIEVVAEAEDLQTAMHHLHSRRPHVLVLDLSLTDGSGSQTIRKLREQAPDTQIVVTTLDEHPIFVQRALAAGALGFVCTDRADSDLPQAIRTAAKGREYISPQVAAR